MGKSKTAKKGLIDQKLLERGDIIETLREPDLDDSDNRYYSILVRLLDIEIAIIKLKSET